MIEVANARNLPPKSEWPPYFVYVGRQVKRYGLEASPLRNPFRIQAGWHCQYTVPNPNRKHPHKPWHCWSYPGNLSRKQSIRLYESMLHECLAESAPELPEEMARLWTILAEQGRLTLVCWCAPKPCHGDVIRRFLEALPCGG